MVKGILCKINELPQAPNTHFFLFKITNIASIMHHLAHGITNWHETDLIFPGKQGHKTQQTNDRSWLINTCKFNFTARHMKCSIYGHVWAAWAFLRQTIIHTHTRTHTLIDLSCWVSVTHAAILGKVNEQQGQQRSRGIQTAEAGERDACRTLIISLQVHVLEIM